jgi:hypothetical protein
MSVQSLLALSLLLSSSWTHAAVQAYDGWAARAKRSLDDVRAEYDYVIVGGGTSGLTVADRLTEDDKGGWSSKAKPLKISF